MHIITLNAVENIIQVYISVKPEAIKLSNSKGGLVVYNSRKSADSCRWPQRCIRLELATLPLHWWGIAHGCGHFL